MPRIAVIAFGLFAACATKVPCIEPVLTLETLPSLGDRLPGLQPTCARTIAASAQMWRSYHVIAGGIRFIAGVDDERHIRFLSTSDPSFTAPERLRVGDSPTAVTDAAPGRPIHLERGWGHYVELPSGWCAFLDDSWIDSSGDLHPNLGTRELGPRARITMFFKRS